MEQEQATILNSVDGIIKLKEVYNERSKVIADELAEFYRQKELVEYIYPKLRPLHQDILELRYLKNMIWQDICEELNLERITLGKANTELYKIIDQLLKEKSGELNSLLFFFEFAI